MKTITTIYECDCCAAKYGVNHDWICVQKKETSEHDDGYKWDDDLSFCSLECLSSWAKKAAKAMIGLQESAASLHPRGYLSSNSVKRLYI